MEKFYIAGMLILLTINLITIYAYGKLRKHHAERFRHNSGTNHNNPQSPTDQEDRDRRGGIFASPFKTPSKKYLAENYRSVITRIASLEQRFDLLEEITGDHAKILEASKTPDDVIEEVGSLSRQFNDLRDYVEKRYKRATMREKRAEDLLDRVEQAKAQELPFEDEDDLDIQEQPRPNHKPKILPNV